MNRDGTPDEFDRDREDWEDAQQSLAAAKAERDAAQMQVRNIVAILDEVNPDIPRVLNGITLAVEDRIMLLVERAAGATGP